LEFLSSATPIGKTLTSISTKPGDDLNPAPIHQTWVFVSQRLDCQEKWGGNQLEQLRASVSKMTGCSVMHSACLLMFFALVHRGAKVTEARDRIFGQLGIVKMLARKEGVSLPIIQPKYAKAVPLLDLFGAVTVDLIKATGRIAYLSAYEDIDSKRRSDIPS
jgi:hypothetical protein